MALVTILKVLNLPAPESWKSKGLSTVLQHISQILLSRLNRKKKEWYKQPIKVCINSKYRYSEKAPKIWPIFQLKFDAIKYNVKERVEDGPNFVAFSENLNFEKRWEIPDAFFQTILVTLLLLACFSRTASKNLRNQPCVTIPHPTTTRIDKFCPNMILSCPAM